MRYGFIAWCGTALLLLTLMGAVFHTTAKQEQGYTLRLLGSSMFAGCERREFLCDITAYCPGPCCNSGAASVDWSDQLAVGGLSIRALHEKSIFPAAVDTALIPMGSLLIYEKRIYIALDRGGDITGSRVDFSVPSHDEARRFGRRVRQTVTLLIPGDPGAVVDRIKKEHGGRTPMASSPRPPSADQPIRSF